MLKWIVLLLGLLCCSSGLCEGAATEDAALFEGVWQAQYFIGNGQVITQADTDRELPRALVIDGTSVRYLYGAHESEPAAYTASGNSFIAEDLLCILAGTDKIVAQDKQYTIILQRVDPMMLNNPFLGRWNVEGFTEGGKVVAIEEYGMDAYALFGEREVRLFEGDEEQVCPCIYANGGCRIDMGALTLECIIDESGLLLMQQKDESGEGLIILSPEDYQPPAHVRAFLGNWQVLTCIGDVLAEVDSVGFDTAFVTWAKDGASISNLCLYTPDACTVLDAAQVQKALCTIDRNGLMTIRCSDEDICWLVREDSSVPAE